MLLTLLSPITRAETLTSEKTTFIVDVITDELVNPWAMVFLNDEELLVTEREGKLKLVNLKGVVSSAVSGLPDISAKGQGGLLGLALDPHFGENKLIYLSYVGKGKGGYGTEVMRAELHRTELKNQTVIFRMQKKSRGGRHFGSRLVFSDSGKLFVSLGDRGAKSYAQNMNDHRGTVVRLEADGTPVADNPFIGVKSIRPEIFSFGHRNIQGMTLHPHSREVWTHEHGPQGGDEINILQAGSNYGWPVITYGVNYGIGTKIGEGTHKEGMLQPLYKWVPSIAPSGMSFYSGTKIPAWTDNLFVGSLKFGQLVRLQIEKGKVVHEERLLNRRFGRIRDVIEGPDEFLYVLTDDVRGKLLRLGPAQ